MFIHNKYLILILYLQHGSRASEVLHYRLRLLQEFIAVYRPLQKLQNQQIDGKNIH